MGGACLTFGGRSSFLGIASYMLWTGLSVTLGVSGKGNTLGGPLIETLLSASSSDESESLLENRPQESSGGFDEWASV